ncbi:uncharacterized protein LOC118479885 [Helianthus annuus]|uniref:uncharacterized protein LOC118479884 n=1 Tax=Helianthus annuus TaxID=4232 RepID=UPI001652DEBF|nr:uncharacterized protein LOC118479884 [Helianthus annuus]XP_035830639.1 uncharacterized protein LOC118479885 [Helianthus annuus]
MEAGDGPAKVTGVAAGDVDEDDVDNDVILRDGGRQRRTAVGINGGGSVVVNLGQVRVNGSSSGYGSDLKISSMFESTQAIRVNSVVRVNLVRVSVDSVNSGSTQTNFGQGQSTGFVSGQR